MNARPKHSNYCNKRRNQYISADCHNLFSAILCGRYPTKSNVLPMGHVLHMPYGIQYRMVSPMCKELWQKMVRLSLVKTREMVVQYLICFPSCLTIISPTSVKATSLPASSIRLSNSISSNSGLAKRTNFCLSAHNSKINWRACAYGADFGGCLSWRGNQMKQLEIIAAKRADLLENLA